MSIASRIKSHADRLRQTATSSEHERIAGDLLRIADELSDAPRQEILKFHPPEGPYRRMGRHEK